MTNNRIENKGGNEGVGETYKDAYAREKSRADAAEAKLEKVLGAGQALIDDVRRRHPGEELRCPFMIALDTALNSQEG